MIRFDKKFKLEKCITNDDGRPSMKHICFERKFAVSTDGYNMAIVKVDTDPEDRLYSNELLKPETLIQARKINGKFGEVVLDMDERGSVKLLNKVTHPMNTEEKYPAWYNVVEDQDPEFKIGLSAKRLYELSQALGSDEVVVEFVSPTKAMRVYPMDSDSKAFGLCFPVSMHLHHKNTECNERVVLDIFRPVKVDENKETTDTNEQKHAI